MVSFENFVKSMPPSLSKLKVIPSFCFAFKIPDDVTATSIQHEFNTENQYKCDPFDDGLYMDLSLKYSRKKL